MTIEQLSRDVERLERELDATKAKLNSMETTLSVNDVHHTNVDRRLAAIEDSQKWIVRLILGAIILALVGAILQQGLP
jgi:hypothetical protein